MRNSFVEGLKFATFMTAILIVLFGTFLGVLVAIAFYPLLGVALFIVWAFLIFLCIGYVEN